MNKSNDGFICPICGKERYCISTATFRCGYGSIYDGEVISVKLCGDCVDSLIHRIPDEYIEPVDGTSSDKVINIFNYY